MEMPKYNYPVSLIPGGCPQFLDFAVDPDALDPGVFRFTRLFREKRRPESTGDGREAFELICLEEDENGRRVDLVTGAPSAEPADYEVEARKSLEPFFDRWVPLPILRMREVRRPDGEPMFGAGPANWARCRIAAPSEGSKVLRVVVVFDTTVEEPAGGEQTFALSPDDVAAGAVFAPAWRVRDNTWFVNAPWVDRWLFSLDEAWREKAKKRRDDSPFVMEYLANYLTFLELLHRLLPDLAVRVINPGRDTPVDVDLILDIGNSRTTGILVETPPQRPTSLNNSYLLQIRDLSKPEHLYTEPFATRIEFSDASFGDDAHSRLSGRKTPAFPWPSAVRMGPEAARLATFAKCTEGTTGMSSPKRYLWDERAWKPTWRFNTGGGYEPMVTRGPFAKQVNHMGTPLCCFDDPAIRSNPLYARQEREIAFESQFTRSSLMMFLLAEVLMQALVTINSPAQRLRRELSDLPRRLRRVIFTVPSGMPIAEQRIYRRWVRFAVRTVWEALGWGQWYTAPGPRRAPGTGDYRQSPETRCNWDEASCTQLVYLYNEIAHKFQGDAHNFFRLVGKPRPERGAGPCLRLASIDIGGGTTDLSIADFTLDNDESSAARIKPHLLLRDGFNIAGDDIVRGVLADVFLPALEKALAQAGVPGPRAVLGQCFGRDVIDSSQEQRNLRAQFTRQVAVPAALGLLAAYEAADPLHSPAVAYKLGDFFGLSLEERDLPFPLAPMPGEAVIAYLENAVRRAAPGVSFNLMQVSLPMNPAGMERIVQNCMGRILADLCEVIHLYNCDALLLTGRPSRLSGIINAVAALLPVPADRIIPMCEYRTGRWYPFADPFGMITDPKTTVSMGAILCALAEGHLEAFSFAASDLRLSSTARFIGEMDTNGRLTAPKVWFEVDVDDPAEKELDREISFTGPLSVGFRQFPVERWPTTRFYLMNFASEEDRRLSEGKLPYKVGVRFRMAAVDADAPAQDHDEGSLSVVSVVDKSNGEVRGGAKAVELRLQTLPFGEGYWLDTGVLFNA